MLHRYRLVWPKFQLSAKRLVLPMQCNILTKILIAPACTNRYWPISQMLAKYRSVSLHRVVLHLFVCLCRVTSLFVSVSCCSILLSHMFGCVCVLHVWVPVSRVCLLYYVYNVYKLIKTIIYIIYYM